MGLQMVSPPTDRGRTKYAPPRHVVTSSLTEVLNKIGKPPLEGKQFSFISENQSTADTHLFYAGQLSLLQRLSVAVVGARAVSSDGEKRARRIARELAESGITIVSGLAKGVDVNAHQATLASGGRTAAVIGTPINQVYPAEHKALQRDIGENHLLISPFAEGTKVYPSNFPKRNRVMAALTDGTVIIEASDSSGTLHQAVECEKLGRWLFLLKSVVDNPSLEWPARFRKYERTVVVERTEDILDVLAR